jgi:hypothetical protein
VISFGDGMFLVDEEPTKASVVNPLLRLRAAMPHEAPARSSGCVSVVAHDEEGV